MFVAAVMLGYLGVIAGLIGLLFVTTDFRIVGLWVICFAVILLITSFACWYQDHLWKQDAIKQSEQAEQESK